MSFRGRGGGGGFRGGRGGGGGGRGGGGFRGGRGGGGGFRGGRGGYQDEGPPEVVKAFGLVTHPCQNQLVVKASLEEVPFFNAPLYTEDRHKVGKVDEIFGTLRDYSVSVTLGENLFASSFPAKTQVFIDPAKLMPLSRFLPGGDKKRGGGRGRGGGGRGGGGRGGGFGGGRGGGFRGGRGGGGGFGGGRGGGGGFGRGGGGGGGGFRGGRGGGGRGGGGFRGRY